MCVYAELRRKLALGQPDPRSKLQDEVGKALVRPVIRWHAAPGHPHTLRNLANRRSYRVALEEGAFPVNQ
jgi:hypothetical protein